MDKSTEEILAKIAEAIEKLYGRVLLAEAHTRAVEEVFLQWQEKRGVDSDALREAIHKMRDIYASQWLETLGEKAPGLADSADIRGLLSDMLKRIEEEDDGSSETEK